jgi:hypothetical protein
MGRARVPARREGVPEANGVFSFLIGECYGLRERSRGRGTRTRSLPALDPAAARQRPPRRLTTGQSASAKKTYQSDIVHQGHLVDGLPIGKWAEPTGGASRLGQI